MYFLSLYMCNTYINACFYLFSHTFMLNYVRIGLSYILSICLLACTGLWGGEKKKKKGTKTGQLKIIVKMSPRLDCNA